MKKLIIISTLLALFSACNQTLNQPNNTLSLTKEELATVGNNFNAAASLLVKKAVEKEMSTYQYTTEEKQELDKAIENLKLEFFLNRVASKNTVVNDVEVLQIYKDNADKLKDSDIIKVLPEIKEKLFLQRVSEEKVKYMNSLVTKYDLNNILKKYFPNININEKEALETSSATSSTAIDVKNKT